MRPRTLMLAPILALGLAACGGSGSGSSSASSLPGHTSSTSGAAIFISEGCGTCHTLAAAHTDGNVGPDLDQLRPSVSKIANQVYNGGVTMPAYAGTLSNAQIEAVAKYVASVAGH